MTVITTTCMFDFFIGKPMPLVAMELRIIILKKKSDFLIPPYWIAKLYSISELDQAIKCCHEHILKSENSYPGRIEDVGLHFSMITSQGMKDLESDGKDQKEKR